MKIFIFLLIFSLVSLKNHAFKGGDTTHLTHTTEYTLPFQVKHHKNNRKITILSEITPLDVDLINMEGEIIHTYTLERPSLTLKIDDLGEGTYFLITKYGYIPIII